jgi:hypothetical protein
MVVGCVAAMEDPVVSPRQGVNVNSRGQYRWMVVEAARLRGVRTSIWRQANPAAVSTPTKSGLRPVGRQTGTVGAKFPQTVRAPQWSGN